MLSLMNFTLHSTNSSSSTTLFLFHEWNCIHNFAFLVIKDGRPNYNIVRLVVRNFFRYCDLVERKPSEFFSATISVIATRNIEASVYLKLLLNWIFQLRLKWELCLTTDCRRGLHLFLGWSSQLVTPERKVVSGSCRLAPTQFFQMPVAFEGRGIS